MLVRVFQPEIYAIARRRAPGRFFWTVALTDAKRTYKHGEWLDEDARAIATMPPFVVTISDAPGIESPRRMLDLGYVRCHAFRKMIVLARPKTAACDVD